MTNQEAIDLLDSFLKMIEDYDCAIHMAIDALESKWIPCSERLPEEEGFYLVTMDGEICGVDHLFTTTCGFECGEWDEGRVFAWMPLPEPYSEKEQGE